MGCGAKRRAAAAWVDTQEKSAVRGFLIRWKTVRFSIENRVIAHFVFYAESLRPRKVNKNFGSLKTALWIFCIWQSQKASATLQQIFEKLILRSGEV